MDSLNHLLDIRNIADVVLLYQQNPHFFWGLAALGSVTGLVVAHNIWYRSARRIEALENERASLKEGDIDLNVLDEEPAPSKTRETAAALASSGAAAATVEAILNQPGEPNESEVDLDSVVSESVETETTPGNLTTAVDDDSELGISTAFLEAPDDSDDLTLLEGVDEERAAELNKAGIYQFAQLQNLDEEERRKFGFKFGWNDINWGAWAATAAGAGAAAGLASKAPKEDKEESTPEPTLTTEPNWAEWEGAETEIETPEIFTAKTEISPQSVQDDDLKLATLYAEAPADADDLTQLDGVDEATALELQKAGIYKFSQLEELDENQRETFERRFNLPGFNWGKWGTIASVSGAVVAAGSALVGGDDEDSSTEEGPPKAPDINWDLPETHNTVAPIPKKTDDSTVSLEPTDPPEPIVWETNEPQPGAEESSFNLGTIYQEPPADADDLTLLEGIDEEKATQLNQAGIYKFSQLEQLDEEQREQIGKKFKWPDVKWGKWAGLGTAGAVVAGTAAALSERENDNEETAPLNPVDQSKSELGGLSDGQKDWTKGFTFNEKPDDADDLTQIEGISEEDAARLNAEGVYTISQLENLPAEKRSEVKSKFGWEDIDWGKWSSLTATAAVAPAIMGGTPDDEPREDDTQEITPPADGKSPTDWTWGYTYTEKNPGQSSGDSSQVADTPKENETETEQPGAYTFSQLDSLPEEKQAEPAGRTGWGNIDWSGWATTSATATSDTSAAEVMTLADPDTGAKSTAELVWEAESNRIASKTTPPVDTSEKYGEIALSDADFETQIAEDFAEESVSVHPRYGIVYNSPPIYVDDLTKIRGIGLATEKKLNQNGIYRFKQIANWNASTIEGISTDLDLGTRIRDDEWIPQAKDFASHGAHGDESADETDYDSIIREKYTGHPVEYKQGLGILYHEAPPNADDLTEINGVGKSLAHKLNDYGIYRFQQIADWNENNIAAFNDRLSFKGRIERDEWVPQSRKLVSRAVAEANLEADTSEREIPDATSYDAIKTQFGGQAVEVNPELGVVYPHPPEQTDDLKQIWGVGSNIESVLNQNGVYRFLQIANWNEYNVQEFNNRLGIRGRIQREDWIGQAKRLAEENDALQGRYGSLLTSLFPGEPVTVKPGYGVVYTREPDEIDDLTEINGIGPLTEKTLHDIGVYRFKQIANWDDDAIDTIEKDIDFPGRITRDDWIGQAREFSSAKTRGAEESEPHQPDTEIYRDSLAYFDGENVDIDKRHGIIYTGRPSHQDDLKRIRGIGKYLERELNERGVYRFRQIASWNDYNIWSFGRDLSFPGRIAREDWVGQARELAELEAYREEAEQLTKTQFAGQNVRVDPELGVVYRKRPDVADDLTQLDGIDDTTQARLNSDGIYTFGQLNHLKGPQKKAFASRFGLGEIDWEKWVTVLGLGAGAATASSQAKVVPAEVRIEPTPPPEVEAPRTIEMEVPESMGTPPPPQLAFDDAFDMEPKGIFGTAEEFETETDRRFVFVMDVSRSLTPAQLRLSKFELTSSIKSLPLGSLYQVIFFSGPTWFAHQRMIEGGARGEDVVIKDGDELHKWSSGFGGFEYEKGNENLPGSEWRVATPQNLEATLKDIEEVGKSYGTTWHLPLTMAMSLDPAPVSIYFLTDGETARQDQVARELVEMANATGADTKLNTIALMVPGASVPLDRMAKGTGGHYSLVIAGGKVLKDQDLLEYLAEKDISLDE